MLASGPALSIAIGVIEHYRQASLSWAWYATLLAAPVVVAFFLAHRDVQRRWVKAEKEREEAVNKDRPEVFATLIFGPERTGGTASIAIQNSGIRDARNVQIQPVAIENKRLTFPPILCLERDKGKQYPRMEVDGFNEFDKEGELRYLLRNWAGRGNKSALTFCIGVQWEDSSGNRFSSDSHVIYESAQEKCRTRTSPVRLL